jgi:ATP-dependent DNA helicase DinG
MLRETYFRLKPLLESQAINLMGHGIDGSQSRLMEEFRATPASVIFGASTFWEGVDIQGDDLSCVIIVKLPFLPPNQPIVEARLEAIARRNRSGFYNYTLPEAILRLKQGFGRLIRAQSDRGIVIILDNRIVDKSYGHWFFRSLPIKTHLRANLYSIKERIQNWLTKEPLV